MEQRAEKGITIVFILMFLITAYLAYSSYDYSRDVNELINKVVEKDAKLEARIKKIEQKTGVR